MSEIGDARKAILAAHTAAARPTYDQAVIDEVRMAHTALWGWMSRNPGRLASSTDGAVFCPTRHVRSFLAMRGNNDRMIGTILGRWGLSDVRVDAKRIGGDVEGCWAIPQRL